MMNRRDFFRRAAIAAAGVVAADQIELLERLAHSKVFTTGGYRPVDPFNYPFNHEIGVITHVDEARSTITVEWRNVGVYPRHSFRTPVPRLSPREHRHLPRR